MNADKIAAALQKSPTVDQAIALVQACEPARQQIRDRLAREFGPVQMAAALEAGSEKLKQFDDTSEALSREIDRLHMLEIRANEAREAAITANVRREMPTAIKRLPAAHAKIYEALRQLDDAILANNELFATIGEYRRLENPRPPLDDEQLAACLTVREAIWAPRTIFSLEPPGHEREKFPLSWPLAYDTRSAEGIFHRKAPPTRNYMPDVTGHA
jgi:hypothetical protein